MEEKAFVWTSELTRKLFQLRFQNDWLFKKKKQPWREFRRILLDHGFPKEMTLNHVRKKWSYTYDRYKVAKKTKNKSWRYYKMFDKHFAKTKILDKYESWTDEWRLKLVMCIADAKEQKLEFHLMWRAVETLLRRQDLPSDCCIQDIKGLWHHIRTTFNRKHRLKVKKGVELSQWPLYETMLAYYMKYDPDYIVKLETESALDFFSRQRKSSIRYCKKSKDANAKENDFQWSKDITETFIQIRLQNDWLFRERKWAWNDLLNIMIEEYGFPKTLNGREICRKWAATFGEYQKAKATNNKSWVYYTLFELYLGEGLSLNPLVGWQEEWVINLINARSDLEHIFKYTMKDQTLIWRGVEKNLRSAGIPLDHSLLDLPEIWSYLLKTFKWKNKFANKGMLTEQWPYYELMAHYKEIQMHKSVKKKEKKELDDGYDDGFNDDIEDDMKLLDLKQRLHIKPKQEYFDMGQCRTCATQAGCVYIFAETDDDGIDVAEKLRIIGGVEVINSDHLPQQICMACLHELESAFKFRRKCQDVDKGYRCIQPNIVKSEMNLTENLQEKHLNNNHDISNIDRIDVDESASLYIDDFQSDPDINEPRNETSAIRKKIIVRKKMKMKKYKKYDYWKVCEVCGKHTRNLKSHLDMHSMGKCYSCDVCDKKFKFKSGLIIHKAVHDPTPRKTCEVCGKTFHILAQYRRHFVYHANERKHECDTCGKRFNTADILRVHKRIHTDERPFTCQDCGKTFRTAGCVSRHKRIVHKAIVKNE